MDSFRHLGGVDCRGACRADLCENLDGPVVGRSAWLAIKLAGEKNLLGRSADIQEQARSDGRTDVANLDSEETSQPMNQSTSQPDNELTLCQVAQSLPGRPHRGTVQRWIEKGVKVGRGPEAPRVRLAARKSGGRWYVSIDALDAFRDATTPVFGPTIESKPARRKSNKPKTVADCSPFEKAMKKLQSQGVA